MEGGIEWEETQQGNSRGIWERWQMMRAFVGSMRTLWLRVEREREVVRALSLGIEYVRKFLRKESLGSRHTVRPQWMWGGDVVSRKAEEGRALSANSEWSCCLGNKKNAQVVRQADTDHVPSAKGGISHLWQHQLLVLLFAPPEWLH